MWCHHRRLKTNLGSTTKEEALNSNCSCKGDRVIKSAVSNTGLLLTSFEYIKFCWNKDFRTFIVETSYFCFLFKGIYSEVVSNKVNFYLFVFARIKICFVYFVLINYWLPSFHKTKLIDLIKKKKNPANWVKGHKLDESVRQEFTTYLWLTGSLK